METQVKKREWVKTALIIFLAVLLVLTFFSNTFLNASLPEVAAVQVTSGTVNAKIRGQGTVQANEAYEVTINQTRTIASVMVKTGQSVSVGDTLFVLEQTESDELKTAQDELDQLEQAYEKALISAGNDAATKNHDVQKAQEAYNEAVAIYQQYSTVSTAQITKTKAAAESALKDAQKELSDLQKELERIKTDSEYTDAQAEKTTLSAKVTELQASVTELEKKYRELEAGQSLSEQIQQLESQIREKQSECDAKTAAIAELKKDEAYAALETLANNQESFMRIYVSDRESLMKKISESITLETEEDVARLADNMISAYNAVASAQQELEVLQADLNALQESLAKLKTQQDNYDAKEEAYKAYHEAQNELSETERELRAVEKIVAGYESNIKTITNHMDTVQKTVDDQQALVDKLTTAASAADTVKSTKQTLEDLLFNQSLGDTTSVDMKAQKEQIEKKREEISKLEDNSDELEVKSKVNGTVKEINVSAGKSVGKDMPLCSINVTDRGFTVQISVTNDQAKKVKVGDPAELVNYWGGDLKATLESIANDPQNPGKSKLLVFRLDGEVDADQTLTLSIGQKSANYDALVPNAAVRSDSNGSFVLVLVAKSTPLGNRYTATRADVQVLAKDDSSSAVTGLSYSDFVITTSTKPIEAGTQVRLADQG